MHTEAPLQSDAAGVGADELTPHQRDVLGDFRSQLETGQYLTPGETLGTDDATLLRFLRARKFDLAASKKMICQCLQWRHTVENQGIDALYKEVDPFNYDKREEVFKYWPMWFHKTDKLGRPINIQLFGAFDVARLHKVVDARFHWKSVLVNCEALTREVLPGASRGAGKRVDNAFCIVDLKGFSLTQFWQIKTLVRACFAISQDYYPETMGHLAIINVPRSFTAIWRAISQWLAKETVAKISILGSEQEYVDHLLSYVDAENLPSIFGGKCECEGQGGCRLSNAGPWMEDRDWKAQSWRSNYDKQGRILHEHSGREPREQRRESSAREGSLQADGNEDSGANVSTAAAVDPNGATPEILAAAGGHDKASMDSVAASTNPAKALKAATIDGEGGSLPSNTSTQSAQGIAN